MIDLLRIENTGLPVCVTEKLWERQPARVLVHELLENLVKLKILRIIGINWKCLNIRTIDAGKIMLSSA